MNKIVINWNAVNPVVSDTLSIIQDKYSYEIIKFLNWYEEKKNSTESIFSTQMKDWVKKGIPYMRNIVNILNSEIKIRDQKILQILKSNRNPEEIISSTKKDRSTIRGLREYLDSFLGCRSDFSDWYLNLLKVIYSQYPNEVVFKNTIPFFEDTCNQNRLEMLKS